VWGRMSGRSAATHRDAGTLRLMAHRVPGNAHSARSGAGSNPRPTSRLHA
jgi:hypothetical protein